MQLSQTQTEWLLVRALCESDWDPRCFVVVKLSIDNIKILKEKLALAQSIEKRWTYMACLSFWNCPFGWYKFPLDYEGWIETFAKDPSGWSFFTIESDVELESFIWPEELVDGCRLEIYPDGSARFIGHGEISEKEYRTAEFPIDTL